MKCFGRDAGSGAALEVTFNGVIESIKPSSEKTDLYLAPGWIDVQVNGFAGVDYNSPQTPHEEIARSVHVLYGSGVTRFYPTVITSPEENITGSLRNLARAKETLAEGAAMDGFHVEGPFISPEDGPRGAHPKEWVRKPDFEEFQRWQNAARGHIRIVTVAPEWPETTRFIERLVKTGVVASIGHTQASPQQVADAVAAGASMSTHLGNGAAFMIRRFPNCIWEQLADDRLMASFIVDGVHLPPSYVKVAVRSKGLERAVLVTDAAGPAGCKPGRYRFSGIEVILTEEYQIRMASQPERLAASALSMDRGVVNLMRFAGISLADAVRIATVNPARAGKVPGRKNGLAPGERADFVLFRFDEGSKEIEIVETWVDGKKVA